MKVTDYLKNAGNNTLISFEVLPPLKGSGMQDIFNLLDPLMEFKKQDSGYYEKTAIRKRPGTVGICAAIMHRYDVDAVPHLICGGFNREDTENALIDLNFLEINNVLALRGDALQFDSKFVPEPGGNAYALDLVKQVNDMNHGRYLDENIENGQKTNFCIGIAGYPEKHFEAPNMESDLAFIKQKVEAGAEYIVTQMFFDNEKYFEYVESCRNAGIHIPIVPGLKPLTKMYQLSSIPRHFYINLPEDLVSAFLSAKTMEAKRQVGIEWCVAQSQELKAAGVPCLHYYTMGDVDTIKKIAESVF
jgi:methylenetetrahydrofolate reductase (NADPH)